MMNEYRHKVDVVNGISLLWDRQGSTNTAGAIDMASNDMYTTAAGARDVKDDVLIIITDGHSGDRFDIFAYREIFLTVKLIKVTCFNILKKNSNGCYLIK